MSKYIKDPLSVRIRKWFDYQYNKWWTLRFSKWLAQYLWGLTWIWQKLIYPILYRVAKLYKWTSAAYINIWNKWTYKNGSFSRFSGAMMILATAFFVVLVPTLVHATYQATLFATTAQTNVVYLNNSQEIGEDVHAISGCTDIECSQNETVYYRVRGTLFHHVYSGLTTWRLFHPDLVAGVVAPGVNRCVVKSYGIRAKLFSRNTKYLPDLKPDMLDAVCKPVNYGVQN